MRIKIFQLNRSNGNCDCVQREREEKATMQEQISVWKCTKFNTMWEWAISNGKTFNWNYTNFLVEAKCQCNDVKSELNATENSYTCAHVPTPRSHNGTSFFCLDFISYTIFISQKINIERKLINRDGIWFSQWIENFFVVVCFRFFSSFSSIRPVPSSLSLFIALFVSGFFVFICNEWIVNGSQEQTHRQKKFNIKNNREVNFYSPAAHIRWWLWWYIVQRVPVSVCVDARKATAVAAVTP